MRGLGDEHAVLHPDHASGLAQDDLDLARVAVEALGELDRLPPGSDGRQVDDGALGLRHDLLGDDQHVLAGQRQRAGRALDRIADEDAEVVALADLGDPVERQDRIDASADTEALRLGGFDEDEVLGRIEVDRQRAADLGVGGAGGLGGGSVRVRGCRGRTRNR